LVQTLRWRAQALDDTARQVPAAAAVLSRRVDRRRLATMVELEDEAVVAALDFPLAIVVGHVLDLHRRVSPWYSPWTRPAAPSSP
jgi:hypothetical protein